MTIHHHDQTVTVHHGDSLTVLRELPDNTIDAIVTDPPYGLEFMGKDWDKPWAVGMSRPGYGDADRLTRPNYSDNRNRYCRNCKRQQRGANRCTCVAPRWDRTPADDMRAFQQWCEQWATQALRVLRPGGHLLAFGGTRTFHRLTCAIEDAGFEIRDNIAWLYGSGFPKSLDVSKAIDKAAGATREVIGQHPSPAGNKPGGASLHLSVKGMPESADITAPATDAARQWQGWGTALKPAFEPIVVARKPLTGTVAHNVQAWGTGALNVDGCRIGTGDDVVTFDRAPRSTEGSVYDLGTVTGVRSSNQGRWPANVVLTHTPHCPPAGPCHPGCPVQKLDATGPHTRDGVAVQRNGGGQALFGGIGNGENTIGARADQGFGGEGGPSRFFPVFRYQAKAPVRERPKVDGIAHPTGKPLELMRWLVRLVGGQPGSIILDPFAGSGTTAEACILEEFRCVTIEREADYLPLIQARIDRARQAPPKTPKTPKAPKTEPRTADVVPLYDGEPTLFDEDVS